ncbi:MFS transporter [Streptomyces sp. SID8358]|uniref:MFS transporter n=1 Tax=Streptomyces sp. SID8358 TaxID=2690342 RepID=UPI000DB8DF44|nr:MFS transporter [Streptomyces sp. SID8358]
MDELDSALVRMLQEDGRRTNRDMAQVLGIAPSTCLERIRSLRERGVLTGFHAEADLAAVGRGLQTPSQTSVLSRLDKDGMSSVGGLAAAERFRHQSVAATGGVLVERGLVSRRPDPGDGRRQLVFVTDSGHTFLEDRRLATAIGQPVVGRLIDLFGPRRLFLAGTALTGVAGVVGMLAPDLGVLVVARVPLGFGTCSGCPAAMYLMRSEARRTGKESPAGVLTALAVTTRTIAVIGPSLGGLLFGVGGRRATPAVNIPLAAAGLSLGTRRTRCFHPRGRRTAGDLAGRSSLVRCPDRTASEWGSDGDDVPTGAPRSRRVGTVHRGARRRPDRLRRRRRCHRREAARRGSGDLRDAPGRTHGAALPGGSGRGGPGGGAGGVLRDVDGADEGLPAGDL